jgi:hypothetical protein
MAASSRRCVGDLRNEVLGRLELGMCGTIGASGSLTLGTHACSPLVLSGAATVNCNCKFGMCVLPKSLKHKYNN